MDTVIVAGLPRSGTSLMMQMLEAGGVPVLTDGARAADADNPRGYYELDAAKRTRRDVSWLDQARGRAVKIVHLLLRELPGDRPYRVVLMKRELEEVVASQQRMLERTGQAGADLGPGQLIAAYRRQLSEIETWLAGHPCMRVLAVSYNDLLADPGPAVARLSDFLDGLVAGGLDAGAMRRAIDPSLYRQRRGCVS